MTIPKSGTSGPSQANSSFCDLLTEGFEKTHAVLGTFLDDGSLVP